jgi:hypothetical protein
LSGTDGNGSVIDHDFDRLGRQAAEVWKDEVDVTKRTSTRLQPAQMISADDDCARELPPF